MPFQKGNKLSKGRPKGSPNQRTKFVDEIVAQFAFDPLEILMMIACNDFKGLGYDSEVYHSEKPDGSVKMGYVLTPELRAYCAKEAASYIHAKKRESQVDVNFSGSISIDQKEKLAEEWKAKILELAPAIKEEEV